MTHNHQLFVMFYKLLYFVISTYFAIIIEIINLKTFCVFLFLFKILKTIIVNKIYVFNNKV